MARDVQKRNSQPPDRDRTLRRRGHLPRRLHSRSALRPLVCLSSDARHRRRQSAHTIFGNASRKIATTKNLPHRRSRLFLLRQSNRPRDRRSRRSLPPGLYRQTPRDRRGRRRRATLASLPRQTRHRRCNPSDRRPHRTRWRRRRHRILQGTYRHRARKFRRGPKGRRPNRTQNPTPLSQPDPHSQNQSLQRLRRRRSLGRHRRNRALASHQPRCRSQKIRRTRRYRTRDFRIPGTHGGLHRPRRHPLLPQRSRPRKPRLHTGRRSHQRRPPRHALARQKNRRSLTRIPRHQRRQPIGHGPCFLSLDTWLILHP